MKIARMPVFAALLAALAVTPAAAQEQTRKPLELVGYVKLEKVTQGPAGERRVERVDPQVVVPGDTLIFGTRFANRGAVPIERFVVSNPVPASVRVTAALDPEQQVSVDGGTSWGRLAELEIIATDGSRRSALPDDITHVRWILPEIAAGETGALEFPVTVR